MNPRIRELAEQAGYQEDMFGIGHWDMPECKKFAELIVRECANVTHSLIVTDGKEFPMKSVAYRLKQHFGVEE